MKVNIDFQWLNNDTDLKAACEHWSQQAHIFIDTEFVRRTTFYARVGLIQIGDEQHNYLLDPLNINDWGPFSDLLKNTNVVKVMHSASEDVDVFYHLLGVSPVPLFDTQIACGISGMDAGIGFAKMVLEFCQVSLDKGETTSDWLARPLSDKQCQYAVADIAYLKPCYKALCKRLEQQQRFNWVLEDSQHMINNHVCLLPADSLYRRMKGTGRLSNRELAICQYLCAWRDTHAKALDKPKSRIIKDADVLSLAKRPPVNIEQFVHSETFSHGWKARFAETALQAIQMAQALPQEDLPLVVDDDDKATKKILSVLRNIISHHAEQYGIAETSLASKKDLLSLIKSVKAENALNIEMAGWRKSIVGDRLAAKITALL